MLHGTDRYLSYKKNQQLLVKQSVIGAASEISALLNQLQNRVSVFANTHQNLIQDIAEEPNNEQKIQILKRYAAAEFPDYFSVTIADKKGTPLIDNFDMTVNELCQREIKQFIKNGYSHDIFIHPHVDAYHFDVITTWKNRSNKKQSGILFISIKSNLFARVLKNVEFHGHKLFLTKMDTNGLVEVTSEGARIEIKDIHNDYYLSQEANRNIGYSKFIPGTRWSLVDMSEINRFSKKRNEIILQTLFFVIGITIVSLFLLKLIRVEENLRYEAEQLLKQTNNKLENALEFSNVATLEYSLISKTFVWSKNASDIFGEYVPCTLSQYKEIIKKEFIEGYELFIKSCVETNQP